MLEGTKFRSPTTIIREASPKFHGLQSFGFRLRPGGDLRVSDVKSAIGT